MIRKFKLGYFLIGIFLLLGIGGKALAKKNYYLATNPKEEIYFGHISFLEGKSPELLPLVFREGKLQPERGVLNFPLAPGDIIQTTPRGKCEVQFDTGTILRLDVNSRLQLETIMAPSLSSRKKLSNLVLSQGRAYLMYKRYNRPEIFQIITPQAAVKFNHNSVAYLWLNEDGSTGVEVVQGKVYVLYGPNEKNLEKAKVSAGQQVLVLADKLLRPKATVTLAEFKLWNEELNRSFVKLHEGITPLPLPIQKLPRAVYYFAQKYANHYGEWVWHHLLGYVWRPFANNYYPWGTWQPYYYGHWREINGELFWVPDEPWGWVPYHLGIWTWDEKLGWVWIPGSAFAPAWVTWDFFFGYYVWRPWMFWDWYYYGSGYYDFIYPYYYGGPAFWQGTSLTPKPEPVLRKVRKDQLKKNNNPPYKMPREWKGYYKNFVKKIKQQDRRILSSLKKVIGDSLCLKPQELNRREVGRQAVKLIKIPMSESRGKVKEVGQSSFLPDPQEIRLRVVVDFVTSEVKKALEVFTFRPKSKQAQPLRSTEYLPFSKILPARELGRLVGQKITVLSRSSINQKQPSHQRFSQPRLRLLDWNPDVKVARSLGVSIRYSSLTNEVRCPELRLTSRKYFFSQDGHYFSGRLTSSGAVYSSTSTSMGTTSNPMASSRTAPRSSGASHSSGGARSGNKK